MRREALPCEAPGVRSGPRACNVDSSSFHFTIKEAGAGARVSEVDCPPSKKTGRGGRSALEQKKNKGVRTFVWCQVWFESEPGRSKLGQKLFAASLGSSLSFAAPPPPVGSPPPPPAPTHPVASPTMSQTSSNKRQCRREPTPAAPAPPLVPAEAPSPPPSPPPLLDLLERHPILFALEVLARLPTADRAALAGAGFVWRDAVYPRSVFPTGLPRAETPGAVRVFKIWEFCVSVEHLAWARDNGCPWVARTFTHVAMGGDLEVLQWAWELACPWDEQSCACAAMGGRLEVLKWLREHGCPWDESTCQFRGCVSVYGGVAVGA